MAEPTLVLVGGYGRSGSTMLEMVLSNRLNGLGLGEVKYAWSRGFLRGDTCSCGKAATDCPLWGPIPRRTGLNASTIERLRLGAERNRHFLLHQVLPLPSARYAETRERYREVLARVYEAALALGPSRFVIDSSKDPAHLEIAASAWPGRAVAIHMVRDPRAVVYSRRYSRRGDKTAPAEGLIRSCAEWNAINLGTERLSRRMALARLRYEDFCNDPSVLEAILDDLGVDAAKGTEDPGYHPPHHALSANPLRWEQVSIDTLRLDERWRTELPMGERRVVELACAPVMRRYGYERR